MDTGCNCGEGMCKRKMSLTPFQGATLILLSLIAVFLFFAVVDEGARGATYQEFSIESVNLGEVLSVQDTDVVRGDSNILLVEYSDLDCPFCARFHGVAQGLVDDGVVAWVYRHFPLSSHPNADDGAAIAECVRIHEGDDAFVSYIDSAFERRVSSVAGYESLGAEHGLTSGQISECLDPDSEAFQIVEGHFEEAARAGVTGTPGSFLVNRSTRQYAVIPGALSREQLEQYVEGIR